jgi:hypothetical protein
VSYATAAATAATTILAATTNTTPIYYSTIHISASNFTAIHYIYSSYDTCTMRIVKEAELITES